MFFLLAQREDKTLREIGRVERRKERSIGRNFNEGISNDRRGMEGKQETGCL